MSQILHGHSIVRKSRSYRDTQPRDLSGYTATGEAESETWEGSWDEMVAKAQADIAAASKTCQVSVSVSSSANGDRATYSLTRTTYAKNDELYSDSTSAAGVGKTADNPSFSTDVQEVEAAILTAPIIASKNYSGDTLAALQHIAKGGSEFDFIYISGGVAAEVVHLLPADSDVVDLVRNQESFLDARVVHSVSWETDSIPDLLSEVMTVVDTPTGAPAVPDRDWLYVGGSLSNDGTVTRATKKYWLSGPGGWAKFYGSN